MFHFSVTIMCIHEKVDNVTQFIVAACVLALLQNDKMKGKLIAAASPLI